MPDVWCDSTGYLSTNGGYIHRLTGNTVQRNGNRTGISVPKSVNKSDSHIVTVINCKLSWMEARKKKNKLKGPMLPGTMYRNGWWTTRRINRFREKIDNNHEIFLMNCLALYCYEGNGALYHIRPIGQMFRPYLTHHWTMAIFSIRACLAKH